MKRSIGYCTNSECEDAFKGTFLLNSSAPFSSYRCSKCKLPGFQEVEVGQSRNESPLFFEVRVEYDFEPQEKTYRRVAIVRDDSLPNDVLNSYTLFTPLVKTDKRALALAEQLLARFNTYSDPVGVEAIPRRTLILLSFDDSLEGLQQKLQKIERDWERASARYRNLGRKVTHAP